MLLEEDEQQTVAALIGRAQAPIDIGRLRDALKPLRQALVIEPKNNDRHFA